MNLFFVEIDLCIKYKVILTYFHKLNQISVFFFQHEMTESL